MSAALDHIIARQSPPCGACGEPMVWPIHCNHCGRWLMQSEVDYDHDSTTITNRVCPVSGVCQLSTFEHDECGGWE